MWTWYAVDHGAYSAVVLSGADRAAPIHATLAQGNSFQSSPMTLTVAPPTGGSTLAFFHSSYASDPTVSGGDTDILFPGRRLGASPAALTAADDGTIAISGWAGQATCLMVGIALKPAAAGGGPAALASAAAAATNAAISALSNRHSAGRRRHRGLRQRDAVVDPDDHLRILKTNNGTVEASVALNFVAAYDDATGALVVRRPASPPTPAASSGCGMSP